MTQYYTYRGFSLRRAARPTKVMITAFLATVAVSIAVGVVNYRVRTGLTPSGSAAWYRGNEAAGLYQKTPLELLDATHPHLFGQAFLFFVLCHLFALTPVRAGFKTALYTAAFASVLVDAASPWLIRYVSPTFAWLQLAGTAVMVLSFCILVWVPLKEMWLTPAHRPPPRAVEL
ncbi:MAG TPA: hypothetical protein VFI96_03035 [Longimicrobiaceae bacterium]|nr:hypothetical protein [Longimicrobiaceae bacterium]